MPSVAPLVAGVWRRLANLPAPTAGSGEASNGQPVQVELLVAGVWVDITGYTLVRDDSGRINITSGIRDEGSQTQAGTASLQLDNRDGRFTPRNPSGAYYTLIGRNTPLRVSVPDGLGGKSYRMWGEVSEWASGWDATGTDVWSDVSVNGILQRLAQGPAPERSVIYGAVTDPLASTVVAYWPFEDASGATQLESALTTGSPATWSGTLALASYDLFAASDPLPDLTAAAVYGGVAKYGDPTASQVRFLAAIPKAGLSDGKVVCAIDQVDYSAGSAQFWELYYAATGNTLTLRQHASDGTALGVELPHTLDVRGRRLYVSVELEESGTGITRAVRLTDVTTGAVVAVSDTVAVTQLTRVASVQFGPASRSVVGPIGTQYLPGVTVGHVTVENAITATTALGARLNPIGETAGRRIQRLCGEDAIPFEWIGELDDTVPLGAQPKQNPISVIQEAVLADGGMLYETSERGLGYRTRASLYNQTPALVLDYAGFNLAEVPVPVEDDRYLQNRVVVTVNGVSETYEETSGTLGTGQVGTYGETSGVTLNLATPAAATLRDQAAWRVHLGTVDEARYPKIAVNLAHPSITPDMRRAILALRIGDRMQIVNMPGAWLPPDTVDLLVLGRDESISRFMHTLTFVCAPASPYNSVGVVDDPNARIDIDGSQLLTDVTSAGTSLTVVPSAGKSMLWTTAAADWPFDARMGGEVVRVTAVTGWLSDTFTRTVSSSWGTPDVGSAWSTVGGGVASDYAVNAGVGVHTLSTVDDSRRTAVTAPGPDFDIYSDITTSALALGDSLYGAVTARMQDASTMYMARLEFTTSNTIVLALRRLVADAATDLGTYTLPGVTHVAGTFIRVRFQGSGSTLKAKAWLATDAVEPPEWHASGSDSAISSAYFLGTRSVRITGNTNAASVAIQYDNYQVVNPQTLTVTRSINGVAKAQSAGTDIRLATPTYVAL
ncbi:hypothetical protein ABZT03_11705 [Streptomyces sp. NPDC005574]|uniref:hypothetical protein n=1 Tax=Streptomyces sp. NPDC005574 TaxID=3156891 RepID=UPI0033A64CF7